MFMLCWRDTSSRCGVILDKTHRPNYLSYLEGDSHWNVPRETWYRDKRKGSRAREIATGGGVVGERDMKYNHSCIILEAAMHQMKCRTLTALAFCFLFFMRCKGELCVYKVCAKKAFEAVMHQMKCRTLTILFWLFWKTSWQGGTPPRSNFACCKKEERRDKRYEIWDQRQERREKREERREKSCNFRAAGGRTASHALRCPPPPTTTTTTIHTHILGHLTHILGHQQLRML